MIEEPLAPGLMPAKGFVSVNDATGFDNNQEAP